MTLEEMGGIAVRYESPMADALLCAVVYELTVNRGVDVRLSYADPEHPTFSVGSPGA